MNQTPSNPDGGEYFAEQILEQVDAATPPETPSAETQLPEAQSGAPAAASVYFAPRQEEPLLLKDSPVVGIFDSGIGGFTVAKAILSRRPDISLVYYADSLNLPYGGRSREQLTRFAHNTIEFLLSQGIDVLAVGCNASNSALGQSELRSFGVPVFDLVGSTIDWLRNQYGRPQEIGLLGTLATVRSQYWERKLKEAFPDMQVHAVAAPEFVPLIEAQEQDLAAIRRSVRNTLRPLLESGVRSLLFGCTHYPLLSEFMLEVEPGLQFIDPAECLAGALTRTMSAARPDARPGTLRFFNSLPGERFYSLGERVFGRSIRELTKMYIVNPFED
jgi:glutamate racemase